VKAGDMPRQEGLAGQNGSRKLAVRLGLESGKSEVQFFRADQTAWKSNKNKALGAIDRFLTGENFLTLSVLFRPRKQDSAINFRQ
jgi:hypothetical protein